MGVGWVGGLGGAGGGVNWCRAWVCATDVVSLPRTVLSNHRANMVRGYACPPTTKTYIHPTPCTWMEGGYHPPSTQHKIFTTHSTTRWEVLSHLCVALVLVWCVLGFLRPVAHGGIRYYIARVLGHIGESLLQSTSRTQNPGFLRLRT